MKLYPGVGEEHVQSGQRVSLGYQNQDVGAAPVKPIWVDGKVMQDEIASCPIRLNSPTEALRIKKPRILVREQHSYLPGLTVLGAL